MSDQKKTVVLSKPPKMSTSWTLILIAYVTYGKRDCADIIQVMDFKIDYPGFSWWGQSNHIALKSRELSPASGRRHTKSEKPTIAGCDSGAPETLLPPYSWSLPATRMNQPANTLILYRGKSK